MCDAQRLKQTDIGLLIVNDQDAGVENVGRGNHHGSFGQSPSRHFRPCDCVY
jgi:hypothetical protein